MTATITIATDQNLTKCPLCGLDGIMMPVEFLPKAGVAMKCVHRNGDECKWARFGSIEDIGVRPDRKRSPRNITCPKCGREGIVNEWQPEILKPEKIEYYVRHGKIEYGEGNSRKQERCFIRDEKQRDEVLKQIGRYIERPEISLSAKIITCPKCGKRGHMRSFHPNKKKRPDYVKHYVDHVRDKEAGKIPRCVISDPQHRQIVNRKLVKDNYEIPVKSQEIVVTPIRITIPNAPVVMVKIEKLTTELIGTIVICPCGKKGKLQKFFDKEKGIERYRVKHLDSTNRHYIPIGEVSQILGEKK